MAAMVRPGRDQSIALMPAAMTSQKASAATMINPKPRRRDLVDGGSLIEACDRLRLARENLVRMFAQP